MDDELKLSPLLISAGAGLCVPCLAARSAIAPERVETLIDRMRSVAPVRDAHGPCSLCGREARLYAIDYPLP